MNDSSLQPSIARWKGHGLLLAVMLCFLIVSTMVSTPQPGMANALSTAVPTVPSPGQIVGVVFEDRNGNGIQDSGEPGVPNVTVTRSTGSATTTDAGGNYKFTGVAPGSHTINLTVPAGYVAAGATSRTVNVDSGAGAQANFALLAQGVIQGVVFDDRNGNNVQDASEPGLAGVTVKRLNGPTTTTDANGAYRFSSVPAGRYTIELVTPAGYFALAFGPSWNVNVVNGGAAQVNFPLVALGVIQGVVFDDRNGNDRQDPGESGIEGVTVQTLGADAMTAADGTYRLEGLLPDTYNVQVMVPIDLVAFGPTNLNVVLSPGGAAQANFAFQTITSIRGVVFEDLNGNVDQDVGEVGVGGVRITRSDGVTQLTEFDGEYYFANVPPGVYTLAMTVPAGFVAGGATSHQVNMTPGIAVQANFVLLGKGVIQGVAFEDRNGNGQQDAGEPGVAGVTVARLGGGTRATGSGGAYSFGGITPGSYSLEIVVPPGYLASGQTDRTVNVGSDGAAQAHFALQAQGTIQGVVFEDRNGNGQQDNGEPGISGVVLSRGKGVDAITTGNGVYTFAEVDPGSYTVEMTVPDGFVPAGVFNQKVNLGSGGSAQAAFALQALGTIQGVVFEDRNGNGQQDGDETGIGGVTVARVNGPTRTTDSLGGYTFNNVVPGSYTLDLTVPAGYVAAGDTRQTVNIGSGGAAQANFVLQAQGVIQGVVYDDLNGNREQDNGEPGVGGVVITRNDGPTTTTDLNGGYRFSEVDPANYTLTMTVPSGFIAAGVTVRDFEIGSGGAVQANFRLQVQGVIQGVVFDDHNGNEVQDGDEPGIGGVLITRADGPTVTTDSRGGYRFDAVDPGIYTLNMSVPIGFAAGGPVDVEVNLGSGGAAQAVFALLAQGVIQGVVYDDRNGNKVQDSSEPGIGGVTITRSDGPTVTTNIKGGYQFTDLNPGTYLLEMTVPTDFVEGDANPLEVTFGSGGAALANFMLRGAGVIQGVVFEDINGNTRQDPGEPGIPSIRVTRSGGASTFTGIDGSYRFADVSAGAYSVAIADIPPAYAVADSGFQSVPVSLDGAAQAHFALFRRGVIQGATFHDRNGNGIPDTGEAGVGGVIVRLLSSDGTQIAATTSAPDGTYRFTNFTINQTYYYVLADLPIGYTAPRGWYRYAAYNGGNLYKPVTIALQPGGVLQGVVFDDRNSNGVQDVGEPGVAGVSVSGSGSPQTTNAQGTYRFTNVPPGRRYVSINLPANYAAGGLTTQAIGVPSDGTAQVNFALLYNVSGLIRSFVFADTNSNGYPDVGESGIGGISARLYLYYGNASPVATLQSQNNGMVRFANATPNTAYFFNVTLPNGYQRTSGRWGFYTNYRGNASSTPYIGLARINTLAGAIFVDTNANLYFDPAEPSRGEVVVELQTLNGVPVATTTTNPNGRYEFNTTALAAGNYRVTVKGNVGEDFVLISPDPVYIYIYEGGVSYGYVSFVANEKQTVAGGAVPGTILTFNPTGVQALAAQAVFTREIPASGELTVRDLPPGDYTVTQTPPQGFFATLTTTSVRLVEEGSAQVRFTASPANSVTGRVFEDGNGNGVQDGGERGLAGVQVDLKQGNTTVQSAITTLQGEYQFSDVPLGAYAVVSTDPAGYTSVTPNQVNVALSADLPVGFVSFGDRPANSISGVVFRDDNFNGVQDTGEVGMGGVTVTLLPAVGNTPVATQTTGEAHGEFRFDGVPNGNYRVRVAALPEHNLTRAGTVNLVLSTEASSASVNFGQTLNDAKIRLPIIATER